MISTYILSVESWFDILTVNNDTATSRERLYVNALHTTSKCPSAAAAVGFFRKRQWDDSLHLISMYELCIRAECVAQQ